MAITKVTTVQRVEVYPATAEEDARLMVVYMDRFDDPEDDQLPHESQRGVHLTKTISSTDEEGNVTETPTDLTNHDAIVQTIAAVIWAQ